MSNMHDVDHTHPHTDESFGGAFRRGPTVVADGGERPTETEEAETDTMDDVDHESPTEGTTRVFERGTEGRTDSV
ncbi:MULTISPECIES: hypothetical protein [unclassified Halomicrobium]|uniref:hypothetical protein n=1 Tax=unclassified Halomicrobium TaxID=2610901 RepID=UPI0012984A5B|nr:hypothetical protein [Halomicrobium sp. LC1Hm]QGA83040.1 Uncharacterized protein LC1Hm_2003 [Halomicrobium sp. LC1Hm]